MNYRVIGILITVALIVGTASAATYTNKSVPAVSYPWTNATSTSGAGSEAFQATAIYGNNAGGQVGSGWTSTAGGATNQKFTIDFGPGNGTIIRRVYYENYHNNGALTSRGAKNFVMQGSNSASALNITYLDNTGWVNLSTSSNQFDQHNSVDGSDPKNFTVTNYDSYRNYSFVISDGWGDGSLMGIRRLVLQTEDGFMGAPSASFIGTNMSIAITNTSSELVGYSPFTVRFTNTSTPAANISSFVWNATPLSTGAPFTFNSTSASPQYTFTENDNYFIRLNISGTAGANISTQVFWVNTSQKPTIISDFTANRTSQTLPPGAIQFTDTSQYYPDTWLWSFGDGETSTSRNPVHTYSSSGLKTVSLIASSSFNATDTDTETKTDYINITYSQFYINPDFEGMPTSGSPGLLVSFTDLTVVGNTSAPRVCNWSFGDSLSATPYSSVCGNVQHVYTYGGVYDVNLSVTVSGNTSYELKTQYISVSTNQNTQNTWWTPHTVKVSAFDSTYGNKLSGVNITAAFNETSMPDTWVTDLYGIRDTPAAQILNSSLRLGGTTGNDGTLTFTMLGSIKYDIYLTSAEFGLSNYHVQAYPSDSMLNLYVPTTASATPVNANSTYQALNGTRVYFYEPDIYNVTMCIDYIDTSGFTTSVTDIWKFTNNNTVMNTVTFAPGASLNTSCYTVKNTRGTSVWWGYNATRVI